MNKRGYLLAVPFMCVLVGCGPASTTYEAQQTASSENKKAQTTTTAVATVTTTTSAVTTEQRATTTITTTKIEKEETVMDLDAITKGDFSSTAGKWRNDKGYEVVITPEGYVNETHVISLKFARMVEEVYEAAVNPKDETVFGGYAIRFIPRGRVVPDTPYPDGVAHDVSDQTRDRLLMGHQFVADHEEEFFYRVSD